MIALLQRVTSASVSVAGHVTGQIGRGLVVFVGVELADTEAKAGRLLERLLSYRVFADEQDRMNLSLRETGGGLLLVSQFTLAADTRKGNRPGFSPAADPATAQRLFDFFVFMARKEHSPVQTGVFGADIQVSLVNDGPVTFWLQSQSSPQAVD